MSVASPESADNVTNYIANVTVSGADFAATIGDAYPQAQFDDDINSWIGDMQYTDSGRVAWVNIGGVDITGTQIRQLFQLRSAAFTISIDGENVIFETTGYGHGVGMSQYGANIMAENGSTYDEILTWYYTGADIAAM
jgi:stage II sporulation protein D